MVARIGRLLAWVVAGIAILQVAPAWTQSVPPPPLLPGEQFAKTGSGCGVVFRPDPDPAKAEQSRLFYLKMEWRGECRNGLAHGTGYLVGPGYSASGGELPARSQPNGDATPAFFGRFFGSYDYRSLNSRYHVTLDGRAGSATLGDPLQPVWSDEYSRRTTVSAEGWIVMPYMTTCSGETPAIQGCTSDNNFKIYVIWRWRPADGGSPNAIRCPNPKTYVGCEALWREIVAPVYANYQALGAEIERDAPAWRQQLTNLNAPREAQIAALETSRREAQARQQAEAQAAAEKAEKDFQTSLATGNPGQLFALADELQAAGERDRARQVLRALVSKFPSHPLAVTAAQQLSQMASGASPGASASAASSSSLPAASAPAATSYRPPSSGMNEAACKAEVDRLANVLNASQPRNAGNSIRQMETLMFVLKAMADTTDAMCPRTQVYIDASAGFRKTYNDTARTCGQVSSQGACTARLH